MLIFTYFMQINKYSLQHDFVKKYLYHNNARYIWRINVKLMYIFFNLHHNKSRH